MTDIELQKTNTTLRRLSDEMRSYSIERGKEREEELRGEVDRIHQEIKLLQRNNEDSATISDKLSREVSPVPRVMCRAAKEGSRSFCSHLRRPLLGHSPC